MNEARTLGPHSAQTDQVSITLFSASKAQLIAVKAPVHFGKNAPNGVTCGPVCYQARVTVHPDGTLTATPAPG